MIVVGLRGRRAVVIDVKADANGTGKVRIFAEGRPGAINPIDRRVKQREAHAVGLIAFRRWRDTKVERGHNRIKCGRRRAVKGDYSQLTSRGGYQPQIISRGPGVSRPHAGQGGAALTQRVGRAGEVKILTGRRAAGCRRSRVGRAKIEIGNQPVVIAGRRLIERRAIARGGGTTVEKAQENSGRATVTYERTPRRCAKCGRRQWRAAAVEIIRGGGPDSNQLVGSECEINAATKTRAGQVNHVGAGVLYLNE